MGSAETAVEEGKIPDVGAFKIKFDIFPCVIFYKFIDQHMRSTDRSAIRVIAYENIICPVFVEEKHTGSDQFISG